MRIAVDRTPLLKALVGLARIIERKSSVPILHNVLLSTVDDPDDGTTSLRLQTTDLDISLVDHIPCAATDRGSTTLPAGLLLDIVKKSPVGSQLTIVADESTATVSVGRSRFKLPVLPANDYPGDALLFPAAPGPMAEFTMPARDLRRVLDRVAFSQSNEETRWYLNGVHLECTEAGYLRSCATDGHRLARSGVQAPEAAKGMPSVIVPTRTVAELLRMLDVAGDTEVNITDKKIAVTVDETSLTSKLIDGTFPDVDRVIPRQNPIIVNLKPQSLAEAVDRVSAIAAKRGNGIKIVFVDGIATITMSSPDNGVATDEITAEVSSDEEGAQVPEMGFNSAYVSAVAGHLVGDQATIRLADPGSPALILDGGDEASLYVLMPMRVS